MEIIEKNPTKLKNSKAFGGLEIIRIAPDDQKVTIDFTKYFNKCNISIKAVIKSFDDKFELTVNIEDNSNSFTVLDLKNNIDYYIELSAFDENYIEIAKSSIRFFRTGYIPGVVVNYIHPEDYTYAPSGRSPASPSIIKLKNGDLLASHDVFWGGAAQNLTKIFVSKDEGENWSFLSDLYPCFWGKLFLSNEKLYMLGCETEYGALQIFCSEDGGITWSNPTVIIKGGNRNIGGPHKAPMPVVKHEGRLWSAVEHGSWFLGGHDAGVISIDESSDLMVAENWAVTPFLKYDGTWEGVLKSKEGNAINLAYLEGNVVVCPNGELVNILRYHTDKADPDYGKAIILKIDKNTPYAPLKFDRIIDFHGNMSKFTINYDEISGKYYALVNRVTSKITRQRNILTLTSSEDLINWKIERDILNFEDNGWHENLEKVGFQYADWIFHGDDILALSRTAINNAHNFHNANYLTFHRIKNFRR